MCGVRWKRIGWKLLRQIPFTMILGRLCGDREHKQVDLIIIERQIWSTPRQRKRTSKLLFSKNLLAPKLRSVVLHVTCTRARNFILATTPSTFLGAGRGREYVYCVRARASRMDNITRMHLRVRASNWSWFCDNVEGFACMCLILRIERVFCILCSLCILCFIRVFCIHCSFCILRIYNMSSAFSVICSPYLTCLLHSL